MNNFLVFNPAGGLLVRCNSIEETSLFIDEHYTKNINNYKLLMGQDVITRNHYRVVDLNQIPIYKKS